MLWNQPIGLMRPKSVPVTVPQDGPGSVYVPTLSAEWTARTIPPPTACYGLQDASGNLVPTIGADSLAAEGTGHLYQQTLAGWTRKAVGISAATGQRGWGTTSTALDRVAGDHHYALIYAAVSKSGSARVLMTVHGATVAARTRSSGIPQCTWNGGNFDATLDHGAVAATIVRPWFMSSDATADVSKMHTDLEEVTCVHSEGALTAASKGIGSPGAAGGTPAINAVLLAFWVGADAAALRAAGFGNKTLLTQLGWSIPY